MLVIGVVMMFAATGLVAVAGGAVQLPGSVAQRRARTLAAQEPAPGSRWQLLRSDVTSKSRLSRLTAPSMLRRVERNVVLAGRPAAWTIRRVVVLKPVAALIGVLFGAVILGENASTWLVLFAVAIVVLCYFVPDLLIYNRAIKRQAEIQRALPDLLDQIVISIEAGVGFEQALAKAAANGAGPLNDEIVRLLQDVALGMARRDAYLGLADRTSVAELRGFAKAVVQAEEYGVSIASVVRSQAKEMRLSRRMRAETRAQQVPVKILIPLMLCVLPVLFVIVLGPSVVSAYARN